MSREQLTGKHALIDSTRNGYTVGATTRIDWAKVPDNAEFKDEKGKKFIPEFTFMGGSADGVYPLSSSSVPTLSIAVAAGVATATLPTGVTPAQLGIAVGKTIHLAVGTSATFKPDANGYAVTSITGGVKFSVAGVADGTYNDVLLVPECAGITQHAYTEGDVRNNHDNIALYSGGGFYENRLPQFKVSQFPAMKKAFERGATWFDWGVYQNSLETEALPIGGAVFG